MLPLFKKFHLNPLLSHPSIFIVSVLDLPHKEGPHCKAVFSLLNSPIFALQYANSGAKLAVGFECGKVSIIIFFFLCFLSNYLFC